MSERTKPLTPEQRQRARESHRRYRQKPSTKIKLAADMRAWRRRPANDIKHKALCKRWRLANPEAKRRLQRNYRKRHRERINAKNGAYKKSLDPLRRERFRLRDTAAAKLWRERNREKIRKQQADYRERNKAYFRALYAKRRALKAGAAIDLRYISIFTEAVRAKRWIRCYYCLNFTLGRTAHIDHIVALDRGGPHVIGNLCASCPDCNLSKGRKSLDEWNKRLPQPVLPL